MSERDRKYAKAFINNDKALAERLTAYIDKKRKDSQLSYESIDWKSICNFIEYPYSNAFDNEGIIKCHFRRVLNELKTLSVFGKHTFRHFNNLPLVERVY